MKVILEKAQEYATKALRYNMILNRDIFLQQMRGAYVAGAKEVLQLIWRDADSSLPEDEFGFTYRLLVGEYEVIKMDLIAYDGDGFRHVIRLRHKDGAWVWRDLREQTILDNRMTMWMPIYIKKYKS